MTVHQTQPRMWILQIIRKCFKQIPIVALSRLPKMRIKCPVDCHRIDRLDYFQENENGLLTTDNFLTT